MNADHSYLDLVQKILTDGVKKVDRTGTGTISLSFQQMRFDLTDGKIPLLTTKKMYTKGIIHEILWYMMGSTNIKYLVENGVHIWDAWADENGELGPIYGAQFRKWPHIEAITESDRAGGSVPITRYEHRTIDQVANVINKLRTDPTDRRLVISAWNVADIPKMRLPPCHAMFQFNSDGQGGLSCHLYQRSCDVGLGVPFNIVQYSILTHMFAHVTGHVAKEFVWTGGDIHIYNNHIDVLKEQITRHPYESPKLVLNANVTEIDNFKFEDFQIVGYQHHPTIKMEVSV